MKHTHTPQKLKLAQCIYTEIKLYFLPHPHGSSCEGQRVTQLV